ncbi:MAG TPA: tetratricopeptide repeat protein [Pyrinomonadaceae bacterium]
MLYAVCLALAGLITLCAPARAIAQTASNEVVMVLPFENTSNRPEYNWAGESFADGLADQLNQPGLGLRVVSSDERELAYQKLRVPLTTLPSRATTIKLAREAKATMVVIGTYSVTPGQGEALASLQGRASVIRVNEGRLMGEMMDGRWATPVYDFGGALTTLQDMQARLAFDILYQRDKALPFSLNQFLQQARKIPPLAFEAYIKAKLTSETDPTRAVYLKNALRFYADANAGATYPQAAFELGHFYLKQQDWRNAAEYFSKLQKREPHYAEAAFYAGLSYWKMNDYSHALASLVPLASEMPLTGIYNNAGAISVQAARAEKKPEERTRLLNQALNFLSSAAESSPADPTVRFNYGYALFLLGKYEDAADQLRPVLAVRQGDGEAYFLFAKSLERTGKTDDAASADNQARRNLQVYAKWQTEWQKSQTTTSVPLRLTPDFNRDNYYAAIRDRNQEAAVTANNSSTQDLLAKARDLYAAGRDEEALPELRRILTIEPMNAEAYLLIGRINQRRGDLEASISALRTAIFWDAKLIDAHILLGRIFIERGDRAQAMSHAKIAIQIDPNNPEAIALQRLVETGGK